jgi:hypothetical protein
MAEVTRTQSPSVVNNQGQNVDPAQWNPDMATMAMMKDLIKKWPTPTIVNARFTVFHGVWTALNHVDPTPTNPGNPTYYDCSYRLSVYQGAGNQSVNKDGKLFNSIFALAMKPQYIIQGMPLLSGENEQKPGLLSRMWSGITGRGQQQQQTNGSPK